ncbi:MULTISPECIES: hypothetical protein [Pseudomonas]|uniref:hypothetical protein n=1 Tax=Pseudomonas TaxID=286 RepID=UPI001F45FD9D|nr:MULTISPECIES: hypothetical protein [Pseudomonas]WLH21126.1 hypothetical protein PSH75_13815 [Pseudomonas simiae]WLI32039.1 hypothetical protein PSH61_13310 [Pseudomonas rhodesiae]
MFNSNTRKIKTAIDSRPDREKEDFQGGIGDWVCCMMFIAVGLGAWAGVWLIHAWWG